MIRYGALKVTKMRSYFPKKTGISKYFSPYAILRQRQIDSNKEFVHSFGYCVQAVEDSPPKNNNLPRSRDCIYLRAADALQGGHELMDLATSHMITRPKVIACAMARMVNERVELLAELQGYKTLKVFNRVKKEMILTDADLLAGVGEGSMSAIVDEDGM